MPHRYCVYTCAHSTSIKTRKRGASSNKRDVNEQRTDSGKVFKKASI